MKAINEHNQSVHESDKNRVGVGKHPESAGGNHGSDSGKSCPELGEVVQALVEHYLHRRRRELPARKHRSMMEVS